MRLLLSAILTLVSLVHSTTASSAECTPSFPYAQGWLGGDGAYSVPLAAGRSLWLFGDSFVGAPTQNVRRGSKMIANTVAISTCRDGKFDLRYFWRDEASHAPRPFFDSGTKDFRFWPMDGFVSAGSLYVALLQVAKKPLGGAFGFEMIGVKLARIKNPAEDPLRWEIDYIELASSKIALPGVSAIVADRWVYLFAVMADDKHPSHPMILTRIPLARLAIPTQAIEYLAKDGAWKRGLNWADARIVIDAGHTEMSVRYHSDIRKWIAVQQKPGLGAGIGIRTTGHMEGPWSSFESGLSIEEKASGGTEGTFCYAAKEHIEFRTSADMLVTYVCNAFDLRNLISDMSLYRPQVVWVPTKR